MATSTGQSAPLVLSQLVSDEFVGGSLLHYPNPFQAYDPAKKTEAGNSTDCNKQNFQPCP